MNSTHLATITPCSLPMIALIMTLSTGCGKGEDHVLASPDIRASTMGLGGPWECDPSEWCHVSTMQEDCSQWGLQYAADAWPTEGGGYCLQRFACGPNVPLCSPPIDP